MPTLGGNDSLRGYRDYRFRGPHALLLQAEYRFEIWSGLDAALFYDAGKVAMRRANLDLDDLESDYGVGSPLSTRITASSFEWTLPLGVAMASIFGSSSVASSRSAARWLCATVIGLTAVAVLGTASVVTTGRPHFYPDDPLWIDNDAVADASSVKAVEDANSYDFVVNTFATPGERRDLRAMNVNTLDEVPDSAWFVNRIGRDAMSVDEVECVDPIVSSRSHWMAGRCLAAKPQACSLDSG